MKMPGSPARYGAPQPSEPVIHELPPLRYEGGLVPIHLELRRTEDGFWRARLLFGSPDNPGALASTAEIFCAVTEAELWECVQDLREHHVRDLYRSVTA
jgi:hypothetical protein